MTAVHHRDALDEIRRLIEERRRLWASVIGSRAEARVIRGRLWAIDLALDAAWERIRGDWAGPGAGS